LLAMLYAEQWRHSNCGGSEMTKEDIIMHIKHIVVEQCEKDPEDRDIFAAFGALIDKIEESIKEEEA